MNEPYPIAPSTDNALVLWEYEISDIQGRILTILESLGLPVTQEKAAKDLLRKAVWEGIPTSYRIYLRPHEVQELNERLEKSRTATQGRRYPS